MRSDDYVELPRSNASDSYHRGWSRKLEEPHFQLAQNPEFGIPSETLFVVGTRQEHDPEHAEQVAELLRQHGGHE
jgi:hypothetical protein